MQCVFKLGDVEVPLRPCTSHNDNPKVFELNLARDELVTSVSIRYGALVDSLTLTTSHGQKLRVGGSGGEHTSTVSANNLMHLALLT